MHTSFLTQEEKLEVGKKRSRLYIGVPRETILQENRVTLVPEAVALLVSNGHRVVVETRSGEGSHFSDKEYSDSGAEISYNTREVYQAEIIMKVAPPTLEEIEMLQNKQTIFSALQIIVQPKDYIQKLISKRVSALAFDMIRDEEGIYPVVRAMGEIAGSTSILIAAELLSNVNRGKGLMMGGVVGVPATEVVILGAGTVGEYAARSGLALGATVKIFDNSLSKLRRLQNDLGRRIFTCIIRPDVLLKELKTADVIIGAIRVPGRRTPCVVTDEMVSQMKEGAVIVDVSIDRGGCFETTRVTNHNVPTYRMHGVIHYCVPNIASRVARTASYALSNIFAPILLKIGEEGGINNMLKTDKGLRCGVYIYNGILTDKMIGESLNLPYKDIDLLMVAF